MIGLDTNVLLRYLVRDDVKQLAQAAHLIEQQLSVEEPGFVSLVVLAEVVWNLLSNYEFSREELITALERLLSIESLALQNSKEVSETIEAMRTGTASFPDALIGYLSLAAGCTTTYTFDRKASRLPGFTLIA